MADITIVPVEPWHVEHVAENMRDADKHEVLVLGGYTPRQALDVSVNSLGDHFTALFDGEPAAIFGVSRETLLSRVGIAWLLGTNRLRTDWRAFARASRPVVDALLRDYDALSNVLLVENRLCMRWLAWLGASFQIHGPYARFLICAR